MKFSVVIPNLNSPTVQQVIDVLHEQQAKVSAIEIIVVGLDEPGLVKPSPEVCFVSTGRPVSPGMARSIGCKQATGEILCFLDADCIPCTDWLELVSHRFQDPSVDVLGGGVACSDTGFWMQCEYISSFHDYLVSAPKGIRSQLPTLNLIVRRAVFEQVGGFDESLPGGEDADITIRLRANGYPLYFDPRISVDHRPNRRTARAVIRRTWWYAYHSMLVHPRWKKFLRPALPLRHRWLLLLMSPFLALGVTANIYRRNVQLWRLWYMAPSIFGLKMVWCLAAAERLRTRPV